MEPISKKQKIAILLVVWAALIAGAWFLSPLLSRRAMQSAAYVTHIRTEGTMSPEDRAGAFEKIRALERTVAEEKLAGNNDRVFDLYREIGHTFEDLGQNAKAYAYYARVLAHDPKQSDALFHTASLFEALGLHSEALDAWRVAIENDPGNSAAYERLALVAETVFYDYQKASGVYVEGLVRAQNAVSLMRAYALFLERRGEEATALLYWKSIAQKDPTDTQARDHVRALELQ
jgi:tetratricopeptide (TPR) repeat protein